MIPANFPITLGTVVVGDVARFKPTGVQLIDGRTLEGYDAVVLATGYANDFSWLPADVEQRLGVEEDGLYLYRHVLPPRVAVRHQTFETSVTSCVFKHVMRRIFSLHRAADGMG
jgi:hypothetical protein